MSQTETLLLFVLGFCVALFVVLLFGRGVWALFGSWSGWRELRRQPAAILELQAERDSLKAEKAMMAQKLEASITDMKMRMAEQMAEVSRNRNRLLDMGQTLKEREATISHLMSQLEDRSASAVSLNSQIEDNVKSINLAYAKMAQREEEHSKMQSVLKEAQATLLLRDEKIRNLIDETKALRELAANHLASAQAADADSQKSSDRLPTHSSPALASHSSTEGFEPFQANANAGNPLLQDEFRLQANGGTQRFESAPAEFENLKEVENVDRSVSNVLSLAERVRSLKSGLNKS